MTTHNSINGGGRQFMADDEFPDLVQLTNTLLRKGQDMIIGSTLQTTTQQQQHPPITNTVASSTINTASTTTTTTNTTVTTLISSLIQSCTTTQQHLRHYLIDLPVNHVSHWLFASADQVDGEMSNHNNNNNEEWISRIILVECLVLCIVLSLIVVAWRHYYPFIELLLQQRKPAADVDIGSEEQIPQQQQHQHQQQHDHMTTSSNGEIETAN